MAVGYTARLVGIVTSIGITLKLDLSGHPFQRATFIPDVLFCFLSTIPRATIQGALGSVPVTQGFFQHSPHRHHVEEFIFIAARLYIFCSSICGMLLLNFFGTKICIATADRPNWNTDNTHDKVHEPYAAMEKLNQDAEPEVTRSNEVLAAISILAEEYDVDPEAIVAAMRRAVALECRPSDLEADDLPLDRESPDRESPGSVRTHVRSVPSVDRSLTLTQFECTGALFNEARKTASPTSASQKSECTA